MSVSILELVLNFVKIYQEVLNVVVVLGIQKIHKI